MKGYRKFSVVILSILLIFVLILINRVDGSNGIRTISVITMGFTGLEVAKQRLLKKNG